MDGLWTLLKVAVAVGTIGVLYSWSQKNDSEQQGQRRQSQQPPQQQQKPPPPQPQQLQPNQRAPPPAPQKPPPQQVLQLQQQPKSWAQVAATGNQNHQHQQQPKPYSYNPATIHEEDESYHEGEYSSESEYSEYDESNEGEYTDDQQEEEDEEDEEDDSCDCGRPYLLIRGVHICRYYGRFQCQCGNRWTSAYTWRGKRRGVEVVAGHHTLGKRSLSLVAVVTTFKVLMTDQDAACAAVWGSTALLSLMTFGADEIGYRQ